MGVVGGIAVLLLSTGVAFAKEQATSTRSENKGGDYRMMSASTTERMQTVRDEAKTRMTTQREKAMKRVADIRDGAKQEMAQRIAVQFDNLNSTWTDKFMKLLDRYDALLVKVESRVAIAASAGEDTASTTAAIQSAKTAILTARTAVVAQAAKTYVLDPSTIPATATSTVSGQEKIMKSLRTSFQTLHTTLFKDLFALRDGPMKSARTAVQNAIQSLNSIPGADEETATSTAASNR